MKANSSIDPEEIAHFSRMADEWWDENGKFKPLHRLNPARLAFLRDRTLGHFNRDSRVGEPLKGLRLIDIGCGGGLVAEPMARLGARVTGIDAAEKNIAVAGLHAEKSGLAIDYRCATAEALAAESLQFDIVLALEIVEHVADAASFVRSCAALAAPGGLAVFSTLNRTAKSYAMAILGAEYVLRWLPVGTHQWNKFLRPSELCRFIGQSGLEVEAMAGLVYRPLAGRWEIDARDLSVNYLVVARQH